MGNYELDTKGTLKGGSVSATPINSHGKRYTVLALSISLFVKNKMS